MSDKTDRDPFNARYDRGDDDASDEQADAESGTTPDSSNSSKTSKTEETDKMKVESKISNPSKPEKTEETTEGAETAESTETSGTNESGDDLPPVRERQNINMYIADDDLVEDFKLRYQELNLRWRREHGEDLPKNDEFYPALLRSALNEATIAEELGLE